MAISYKGSKIMSNSISLEIGIDGDQIDVSRSSISFRNFRNLLSDGVIQLDETSLLATEIPEEQMQDLFSALIAIYEGAEHKAKLALDSKLQEGVLE